MSRLPVSSFPLLTLANQTSKQQEVKHAIDKGVISFFIEAWTAYSANEMREQNMLDGISPIGALDLGLKIFCNIEDDFNDQYKKAMEKGSSEKK